MADKKNKNQTRRLPKGKRVHVRRLKQEARKTDTVYKPGIV
jgi:hypothetical protein